MLLAAIVVVAFIVSSSAMTQGARAMGSGVAYRVAEDLGSRLDIYLAAGKMLRSALEADPGMDEARTEAIAEGILEGNPGIVGVSTAPGAVIDRYYPAQAGVAWKGHDLLSNPERKDALLNAVELKTPVVTGPFEAVDGSSSLFLRYPIFSAGKVWGFSSLTVDFPKLLSSLELDKRYPGIYFALADVSQAKSPRFIGGKEAAMAGKGAFADIARQGIAWRIYAAPATGWVDSSPFFYVLLAAGLVAAVLLYVLLAGKAPPEAGRKPRAAREKPSWGLEPQLEPRPQPRLQPKPEEAPSSEEPAESPEIGAVEAEPRQVSEPRDEPEPLPEPVPELEQRFEQKPRLEQEPMRLQEAGPPSRLDPVIGGVLFPDLGLVEKKRGRALSFKGPAVKGDLFMPDRLLGGWSGPAREQAGEGPVSPAPAHEPEPASAQPPSLQPQPLQAAPQQPALQPGRSPAPAPQPPGPQLSKPQPPSPARQPRADYLFSLEEEKSGKNLAILVVDDSEANRDIVGRMLSLRGYKADFAASGADALNLAASRSYDVIFMDSYMPGMDGHATTRALRAENLTAGAFIVGMSAKVGEQELDKCRASGMDDLLAKPFTLKQLLAFLERPRS
jgi:CheY-like chemotaxis protein/sensor domain CHASE-containing protein